MKAARVLATIFACSALSSALSSHANADITVPTAVADGVLNVRQNENDNTSQDASSQEPSSTPSSVASGSSEISSNTVTQGPQSGGASLSGSNTASSGAPSSGSNPTATKGGSSQTSLVAISPQDPVGGLSMITPAATAAVPYYKVGQTITWVWNYTSLLRPPKHIDILATVAAGGANYALPSPFTLAVNETFSPTQTFTWDTGKYYSETNPLPIATYHLVVYDADASGGVSQTPSAGYLGVWQQFPFGMYTPQAPVALANPYICATCNSAASLERMTLSALFATASMTVASFMWFTGGWRLVL